MAEKAFQNFVPILWNKILSEKSKVDCYLLMHLVNSVESSEQICFTYILM